MTIQKKNNIQKIKKRKTNLHKIKNTNDESTEDKKLQKILG